VFLVLAARRVIRGLVPVILGLRVIRVILVFLAGMV
jgi:hypothetical protein